MQSESQAKTIVFYDQSCNVCAGVTGWLSKIDHKQQDSEYLKKHPQLELKQLEKQIHVITEKGKVLKGAEAMLEIWRKTAHFTSPLAYLLRLPPFIWIARPIYNLVAKHRKDIYPNRF